MKMNDECVLSSNKYVITSIPLLNLKRSDSKPGYDILLYSGYWVFP